MKSSLFTLVLLLVSFTANAQSQVSVFATLTPAGSFVGVSNQLKGEVVKKGDEISSAKLTVAVDTFKTENDLRDEHFRKHLNTGASPEATLTNFKGKDGKATGDLEVNGVKKPVEITYAEKDGVIDAKINVKASDFNPTKVKYLGIGVKDEVRVEVKAKLVAAAAATAATAATAQPTPASKATPAKTKKK